MLLTIENTLRIGNPVRIYDANGDQITMCIEADTETGRCVRFVGLPRQYTLDGEAAKETVMAALPLRVVPKYAYDRNGDIIGNSGGEPVAVEVQTYELRTTLEIATATPDDNQPQKPNLTDQVMPRRQLTGYVDADGVVHQYDSTNLGPGTEREAAPSGYSEPGTWRDLEPLL